MEWRHPEQRHQLTDNFHNIWKHEVQNIRRRLIRLKSYAKGINEKCVFFKDLTLSKII